MGFNNHTAETILRKMLIPKDMFSDNDLIKDVENAEWNEELTLNEVQKGHKLMTELFLFNRKKGEIYS